MTPPTPGDAPPSPARATLAGVPVLLAAALPRGSGRGAATARGPVAARLPRRRGRERRGALALAADGFLAVGVDAVGHGARRADDLDARIATAPGGAREVMLALAAGTATELPALVAALGAAGLGDPERVGVVGVSMGGYLAYRAAHAVPGVRAVVALLGSPEWGPPGAPGPESPHRHRAALAAVPLLSITAERDASVPPDAARRLHAALDAGGATARYLELPGAEHLVSADEWSRAMRAARQWLGEHLGR